MSERASAKAERSFGADFRRFFGRGLGILLPSVLTLWILYQLFLFLFNNVGEPINRGLRWAVVEVMPRLVAEEELPPWGVVTSEELGRARTDSSIKGVAEMSDAQVTTALRREKFRAYWNQRWYLQATGIVVAIVVIYFAGLLLGGFLGRSIYERAERLLARVPGFKQVYPHVKQVVQMVLGETPISFNRVVLVEYPRKGIWSLGLVTSSSMRAVRGCVGSDVLTVFVPSTPTPFTGFAINVPASEAIDIPMTVEEALRYVITGGVLIPEHQANTVASGAPSPALAEGPAAGGV